MDHRGHPVDEGFTLIELLIVIVILGVVAGIAAFAVGGITDRGESSACQADIDTLSAAQEAHFAKSVPGAYAADADALVGAGLLREAPTHPKVITTDASGGVFVGGTAVGSGPSNTPQALCS